MTAAEVLVVLGLGELDRLVGERETDTVEFKGVPYQLNEPRSTFELAKDVSGMANAGGGVIVIGFRTRRVEDSLLDEVEEARPFARRHADPRQYRDKLRHRIHPEIDGLEVKWFPAGVDDRGVLAIVVPAQPDERKYFLINQPEGADGGTPGYLVGLAVRRGADVVSVGIQDLHLMIRDGRTIAPRLAAIEALLSETPHRRAVTPADALIDRIEEALL